MSFCWGGGALSLTLSIAPTFLGAIVRVAKHTYCLRFVRPPVKIYQLDSHRMDFREI